MSDKPHRRLSILQPTAATPPQEREEIPAADVGRRGQIASEEKKATVRVMAYLTEEEAEALDDLWIRFRRRPEKPSKSDILRAAFLAIKDDPEKLTDALATMRDTTTARLCDRKQSR